MNNIHRPRPEQYGPATCVRCSRRLIPSKAKAASGRSEYALVVELSDNIKDLSKAPCRRARESRTIDWVRNHEVLATDSERHPHAFIEAIDGNTGLEAKTPKPQYASDAAMARRIYITTTHRVFYTSDTHKAQVEAHMTPEQRAVAQLKPANPAKLKHIQRDPAAASHFANLVATAWSVFVLDQSCKFVLAPLARRVLDTTGPP